jgi:parvulin-like peptidyl-prolyl isomerase
VQRVVKQFLNLFLVTLAAFLVVACNRTGAGGQGDAGNTAVAATVNGKNIMLSEVDKLINDQAQGKQSLMSPLELAQARLQVLGQLVQKEVLFQRAEKEKQLPSEEDVTQFINNMKQQAGMTDDQFQKRLKEQNQTMESLREEARKTLAIQKLQDQTYGKITISDKEVEDYYNNNRQVFVNARGVDLADIVVDPSDNGAQDDAKGDVEAKQKVDLIYQQLKSGADFADVARARSEDPSNVRGGDVGFATEDDLKQNGFPQELIGQLFGSEMQAGSFTAPIRFGTGKWYIFKLKRKQLQTENLTLESPGVREQITNALLNQRKQILNAALLEVAMNDAKIVNNLANNMLSSPSNLSGPRPAGATPAANSNAAPAATTTPTATTSPAATATPQATTSPAATPTATAGNANTLSRAPSPKASPKASPKP